MGFPQRCHLAVGRDARWGFSCRASSTCRTPGLVTWTRRHTRLPSSGQAAATALRLGALREDGVGRCEPRVPQSPELTLRGVQLGFHHCHEGGLQKETGVSGQRLPRTGGGAGPALSAPAGPDRGCDRSASFLAPKNLCLVPLRGSGTCSLRPQARRGLQGGRCEGAGRTNTPGCQAAASPSYLLQELPQPLLAVDGAPVGKNSSVSPRAPPH